MQDKKYKFTELTHQQIIDVIEQYRESKRLTKTKLCALAGYSQTVLNKRYKDGFTEKSYLKFMALCNNNQHTSFNIYLKDATIEHIAARIKELGYTGTLNPIVKNTITI